MTNDAGDALLVRFSDEVVECYCVEDALALTSARDFLVDHFEGDPTPDDCNRLLATPIAFIRLGTMDDDGVHTSKPPSDVHVIARAG